MTLSEIGAFSATPFGKLDYVALLVDRLDEASAHYRETFQATVTPPQDYAQYGFSSVYVDLGYARLKLMQPLERPETIVNLAEDRARYGLHHVSYQVEHLVALRERLVDQGYRPYGANAVTDVAGGRTTFLRPPDAIMPLMRLFEPH
ncbi:VOC family protein [uncultured Reyranella sp.]|uniref:VOC family protein n=1 Tax=uncultured Reyranella sp. TaxID=735512 RepID=UPI0025F15599|nr:VOC family protein [uncultured Reyranella sp.]